MKAGIYQIIEKLELGGSRKFDRMVWVGKNYSKADLIRDLEALLNEQIES